MASTARTSPASAVAPASPCPAWSYVQLAPSSNIASCRVLSLCREPVNSMNAQLWRELNEALQHLEDDTSVQAVVLQSTLARDVFTAGNDINESTSAVRYLSFWREQTLFLSRLYRSRLLCVAAIRGSCPAGGCIMALCCDYRLLTRAGGSMGLNEAALGIPVPRYWMEVMARTVGWRRTEALLQKGELLSAAQAAQFGLVDELVDDAAALLPAAEREVAERLRIPAAGRTASKRLMRDELAQQWEAQWRSEADESWKLLSSDETVRALGRVLQRLSGNKEAGARQQRQAKL